MLSNQHWTEDEVEQTFYALLEEVKIQEIKGEPGKYRPTQKLSESREGT